MTITPAPQYLVESLTAALKYCEDNGVPVPLELQLRAKVAGVYKAGGDLAGINKPYHDAITESLITYFEGGSVTAPRNKFRQGTTDAFYDAFYLGWSDGGGTPPPSAEALEWLTARINQEYGHIDMLIQNAKELRKDSEFDYFSFVNQRADGYTQSNIAVYNAGVMFAKAKKMLTWHLGETEEHCDTCSDLNGQRHRAEWYLSRNYIPQQPGAAMDCGGWRCQCFLTDDKGEAVTI